MNESRNFGEQPLAALMTRLGVTAAMLVAGSANQLTFKMIAKGCKGRKLTAKAQYKILAALHALRPQEVLTLKDLFNY
ncbi:MAG: hypothetical protein H6753_03860 [Candidatus Omnitrophica bacterium]|nr:hypothetical protein [Candidatus Omnitrophota bacterium]